LPGSVDLLDFYRGTLSPRRLWVILRNLPPTSQFVKSIEPIAQSLAWTPGDYILAAMFDRMAAIAGVKTPPFPRPVQIVQAHKEAEAAAEFLAAQAERNRIRDEMERAAAAGGS
jgi:regulator of protease activity HflC (stomatin/prohibitin superfamily)